MGQISTAVSQCCWWLFFFLVSYPFSGQVLADYLFTLPLLSFAGRGVQAVLCHPTFCVLGPHSTPLLTLTRVTASELYLIPVPDSFPISYPHFFPDRHFSCSFPGIPRPLVLSSQYLYNPISNTCYFPFPFLLLHCSLFPYAIHGSATLYLYLFPHNLRVYFLTTFLVLGKWNFAHTELGWNMLNALNVIRIRNLLRGLGQTVCWSEIRFFK